MRLFAFCSALALAAPVLADTPTPPPAPTDPAAIAVLSTFNNVCVPAVRGGSLDALAKSAGFKKSGESYVMKRPGFVLTLQASGTNTDICQVDITSAIDPAGPAAPIVQALYNQVAVTQEWDQIRNDKTKAGDQLLTTRSWQHVAGGVQEDLVFITYRKGDDTPAGKNADTSSLMYHQTKQ